ncbi:MAG: mechanosensitive ion channel family protein, partial [Planctomycetota bacterium]
MFGPILVPSFLALLLSSTLLSVGRAAEKTDAGEKPAYVPTTTIDADISLDHLGILVKPLTKSELEVEADAWFELLRRKARQIAAVQLGVKIANEAIEADDQDAAAAAVDAAESVAEKAAAESQAAEEDLSDQAQRQLGVGEAELSANDADDASDSGPDGQEGSESGADEPAAGKKEELLANVTQLQEERTALSDRLEIVLDSLAEKGGDDQEYRSY